MTAYITQGTEPRENRAETSNFSLDESFMLPVWHERIYEIKFNFPSDKINLSFFPFFQANVQLP